MPADYKIETYGNGDSKITPLSDAAKQLEGRTTPFTHDRTDHKEWLKERRAAGMTFDNRGKI